MEEVFAYWALVGFIYCNKIMAALFASTGVGKIKDSLVSFSYFDVIFNCLTI